MLVMIAGIPDQHFAEFPYQLLESPELFFAKELVVVFRVLVEVARELNIVGVDSVEGRRRRGNPLDLAMALDEALEQERPDVRRRWPRREGRRDGPEVGADFGLEFAVTREGAESMDVLYALAAASTAFRYADFGLVFDQRDKV